MKTDCQNSVIELLNDYQDIDVEVQKIECLSYDEFSTNLYGVATRGYRKRGIKAVVRLNLSPEDMKYIIEEYEKSKKKVGFPSST